jgi:hypothetical protein
MAEVNFSASRSDSSMIRSIVERAVGTAVELGLTKVDRFELTMDLTACHLNGNPLRLGDLLAAPEPHFSHDVFGIHRFINRETGQLTRCFSPRFSVRQSEAVAQ